MLYVEQNATVFHSSLVVFLLFLDLSGLHFMEYCGPQINYFKVVKLLSSHLVQRNGWMDFINPQGDIFRRLE